MGIELPEVTKPHILILAGSKSTLLMYRGTRCLQKVAFARWFQCYPNIFQKVITLWWKLFLFKKTANFCKKLWKRKWGPFSTMVGRTSLLLLFCSYCPIPNFFVWRFYLQVKVDKGKICTSGVNSLTVHGIEVLMNPKKLGWEWDTGYIEAQKPLRRIASCLWKYHGIYFCKCLTWPFFIISYF